MEKIKMVDLEGQYHRIKPEIDAALQSVLDSTAFIQGPEVIKFNEALATFQNVEHVVSCGNGTDALQIALMALDCQPGDEVILPVFTYVATAEVIALLRLKPVFIDVDENTFNLDVSQLAEKVTSRTKAIVPVHLFGQCADMESIVTLARENNLYVIEDAAQAIGSEYTFRDGRTKKAGSMGTIGCTSFFPSKNLGCFGDGGAMMTSNTLLAEKIKMIANHGQRVKYQHDCIGVNSRLDTLQAAILNVKLKYLDEYSRRRNIAAEFYDNALKDIPGLKLPHRCPYSSHVFNQYTVRLKHDVDRGTFQNYLSEKGVPTMIYYPIPLHLQAAYRTSEFPEGSFPVSEHLSKTVISLPIHTELTTDQLDYICQSIKSFF